MRNSTSLLVLAAAMLIAAGCQRQDADQGEPASASAPAATDASTASAAKADSPEVVTNEGCGINSPEPGKSYDRTVPLPAWGYAFDPESGNITANVSLSIAGAGVQPLVVPASRGSREDVALAFNRPELKESGFGAEIDISSLPPGQYTFSVTQTIADKRIVCMGSGPFTIQ